jgi:protein MpaA
MFVAVFLAPTMFGFWFPGRHLMPALPLMIPLVAIGLRRAPRLGAVLGAIGVIASVWFYVDVRWGDGTIAAGRPDAPWGPLEVAWPDYDGGAAVPYVIAALVAIGVAAAFFVDAHVWRRLAGRARVGASASVLVALLAVAGLLAAPGSARAERVQVGRSAEGRAIVASRLGAPTAARKVLVVGQIHGDEPGGLAVTREIRRRWGSRLRGVDLWVVDTFNPDGRRRGTRQNARRVDLNRNFPYRWRMNGRRGSRYWGGRKPLSEPESRAIRKLVLQLRPAVTIWYHQPWGAVLACGGGSSTAVARRYASLASMGTSCRGSGLTGTAASWQNNVVGGGSAFVVELAGGRVPDATARRHARAAALVAQGR